MKRLITLLAAVALFAGISLQAQQKAYLTVPESKHTINFKYDALDVLDADGETVEKFIDLTKKTKVQYYTLFMDIDTTWTPATLGTLVHNIPVTLEESFDGINYTTVSTTVFYGQADTLIKIQDVSTGISAPYIKIKYDGSDADSLNVALMSLWGRFLDK